MEFYVLLINAPQSGYDAVSSLTLRSNIARGGQEKSDFSPFIHVHAAAKISFSTRSSRSIQLF
jgi:hypothetical protein